MFLAETAGSLFVQSMKAVIALIVFTLSGLVLLPAAAVTEKNDVVRVYRLQSDRFPIEVTSRDGGMNRWLLDVTEDALRDFTRTLELDELPFSQLNIRWRPGNAEGQLSFPRSVILQAGMPEVDIDFTGANRAQTVAIKRTLMVAWLQAHIWQGEDAILTGILPEPPLWLSEGLLWESERYQHDEWSQVVNKASRNGIVPSLQTIQGWSELSDLTLERMWQQAFSYCLTRKALQSASEKAAVLYWLKKHQKHAATAFWENSPEVEGWWQEVAARPMQKKIPILTWDQTVAKLNELRHLSLRLADGERKMFFIENLPAAIELDPSDASMNEYVRQMDLLALSAHYALNPAIIRYRNALELWRPRAQKKKKEQEKDYQQYQELVQEARQWEDWATTRKQAAKDALDWSVVNLDVNQLAVDEDGSVSGSGLTDYAVVVRQLENERLRVRRKFQKEIFAK